MALVNNDIRQITDDIDQIEALPKGKIKNLVFDFYHAFKKMGYAPHTNIPKTGTKKSIHFYYDKNDFDEIKAPYSITINQGFVRFYFRPTSNNSSLKMTRLKEKFGVDNVTDNRKSTSSTKGELHIRIHDLEKAEDLISQYILSLN